MKKYPIIILFIPLLSFAQTDYLTLEEAWEIALKENPSEQIALARLEQAEARYRQSKSAYQPRLGVSASGSRIEYSDSSLQRFPPGAPDTSEMYEAGLQATWLLWDSGSRKNRVEASRLRSEAANASLMDSREFLLAQVGRSFTAAQLARANLVIAEADVEFQDRQLENSIRKEEAGLNSRTDSLNFEIRKLNAENTVVQQASNYESAMASLGALLGKSVDETLPPPEKLDPENTTLPQDIPSVDDLWQAAQDKLPALQQATLQLEAAEATVNSLKAEYGPDISLFGNLALEREEDPSFQQGDLGNSLGIQLSWDLWTGDARKQRVLEAQAQVRESEAAARQVQLQTISDIQKARVEYLASVEAEEISAKTYKLTEENRKLIEASYQAGRETLLRLNEAQRDFNNAGSRFVASRLQRQLSWIALQQATGALRERMAE